MESDCSDIDGMRIAQWLMLLFCFLLCPAETTAAEPVRITVAAAANLLPAIDSLISDYTGQNQVKIDLVSGASGQLAAQIRHGAPYDLFLSADIFFPQSLIESGNARDSVVTYARGELVFCTTNGIAPDNRLLSLINNDRLKLAIANPRLAPYGQQSRDILQHIGINIKENRRIIIARNIAQVNHFLSTGAVDAGITAYSAVKSGNWPQGIQWALIDSSLYQPIMQGAVITNYASGKRLMTAQQFLQFLQSPAATQRLRQFGYQEPR